MEGNTELEVAGRQSSCTIVGDTESEVARSQSSCSVDGNSRSEVSGSKSSSSISKERIKIYASWWDGVVPQNVDTILYDIGGDCVYELPLDKGNRMLTSKDGRNWERIQTANVKDLPKGN